ncbi:MAG: alanine racemase [Methylophilales bacterium 28-44-11]|nr:MAG: alanine racemase [Methylophilales bacterium 28-44-11]
MRPIQATVSQHALAHNLNVVKQLSPNSKVMSVVKANGYGHGLFNVAHGLHAADGFAVLGLNEAIDLREAGFTQTILLLEGVFDARELNIAASYHVDVVVHCQLQIDMLQQASLIAPLHVHLKMNTGMNRLGLMPEVYLQALNALKGCVNVSGITLMTHFATADEALGVEKPLAIFNSLVKHLPYAKSVANSASILRYPETHLDWVRPGIMLYGATPVSGTPIEYFNLKPVMQLTSQLIATQILAVGESVGYGQRFTATQPTRIGIVACGYADGYPRHAPNSTPIAVNGKLTHSVGRVSMDMMFCDITSIPDATIGSPVELWGNIVAVDAVAEASGTVGYELLCAVAPRVPMKVVD